MSRMACMAVSGLLVALLLSSCFGGGGRSHDRGYDYSNDYNNDYADYEADDGYYNQSSESQYSGGGEMITCPVCYGTGKNMLTEDVMAQTMPCLCCGGSGTTTNAGFQSFVEIYSSMNGGGYSNGGYSNGGGYSGGSSRDYSECVSCYGRGTCWMCGGKGWNSYSGYGNSGIAECPTCYGNGRCPTCGGSGRR